MISHRSGCYGTSVCAVPLLRGLTAVSQSTSTTNTTTTTTTPTVAWQAVADAVRQMEAVTAIQAVWRRRRPSKRTSGIFVVSKPQRFMTTNEKEEEEERPQKRVKKAMLDAVDSTAGTNTTTMTCRNNNNNNSSHLLAPTTTTTAATTLLLIKTKQHNTSIINMEHWLWRSLRSYAIPERTAAVRLIWKAILDDETSSPSSSSSVAVYWKVRLIRCLVCLMQQHVVRAMKHSGGGGGGGIGTTVRLGIEWSAALEHLMLQEHVTMAATYYYWPWLCQVIYTIASTPTVSAEHQISGRMTAAVSRVCLSLVLHRTIAPAASAVAEKRSQGENEKTQEDGILEQVRALNAACLWNPKHGVACVGADTSSTSSTDLSTSSADSLSPLACLIGAYFLTADSSLERLIDPSAACVVTVAVPSKSSKSISNSSAGRPPTGLSASAMQRASREVLENVLARRREHVAMSDVFDLHMAAVREHQQMHDAAEPGNSTNEEGGHDDDGQNGNENNHNDDDDDDDYDEEIASSDSDEDDSVEQGGGVDNVAVEGDDTVEQQRNNDDTIPVHDRDDDEVHDVILNDEDDDDDDDDDDMDLEELQAVVAAGNAAARQREHDKQQQNNSKLGSSQLSPAPPERRRLYIEASMQVLAVQYPHVGTNSLNPNLTIAAEDALLESVCKIVKPPARPLDTKIILRRAPTQEEFFRGSLSRNPVPLSMLGAEPTVSDLRQHIANDLQMADSAELIEIIIANKILDVNLKLRVVHQVLWKNMLMENNNIVSSLLSSSGAGGANYFSTGSALSIILTNGGGGGSRIGAARITADTPASALPPMVAMYRLAGVDGEATEDTVGVDDLMDPEAPSASSTPEEVDKLLEAEYGLTRLVTQGRGVYVILRSIQNCVSDMLRRIRRDDVGCCKGQQNLSWVEFTQCPPCHGLILLRHCSKLASNRKKLLQARAPTVLLTLLLDVLKALEVSGSNAGSSVEKSNPTAEILQGLIEVLTSDISSVVSNNTSEEGYDSDMARDAASMPLLLQSIETISLSPPLRSIIAKLLPFLTYGQAEMSRELARHFDTHIDVESLARCEHEGEEKETKSSILMNTFVQTAISLPANEVCNTLRSELTNGGFTERLTNFIVKDMPKKPAPWSPALWQKNELSDNSSLTKSIGKKGSSNAAKQRKPLEDAWRAYYRREGLRTAFKILTGLCRQHAPTQARIAMFADFLRACHWLEGTSDSSSPHVETGGLGLLAETLLDEMMDRNEEVAKMVETARKKTRLRKKELAQERRNKALLKMGSFGPLAGGVTTSLESATQTNVRSGFASILAPVVGLFQSNPSNSSAYAASALSTKTKARQGKNEKPFEKPAWLAEAELMQDEVGLTCAVCQEGRTLQPSELLGLYVFVKKVSIPMEQGGSRASIDGTNLLKALPLNLPASLLGTTVADDWFPIATAASSNLSSSGSSSLIVGSSAGRRNSLFTTTVSAGNGIHLSCHRRARQADRTHPKAPKSEWEGAALRNSRVSCNVIFPLVSSHSSKVPLMAVDAALTEYHTAVSNLLGTTPKTTLWTVLHDVRFLILRMAYGESLGADCSGGSLASNCQLLFYQFLMADMCDKNAQVDQPEQSMHARALSSSILAACAIVTAKDATLYTNSLARGIADAATMAAITCIVFHNTHADGHAPEPVSCEEYVKPHPKRQWLAGKDYFLQSLLICAGRRHARGMEGSGCQSSRTSTSRQRSSSFADWDDTEMEIEESSNVTEISSRPKTSHGSRKRGRSTKPTVEDFQNAIRPMVTFYAIMDQLSAEYTPSMSMNDVEFEESAQRMAATITECQRSRSIHELLRKANVAMDNDEIIDLLQKGMISL